MIYDVRTGELLLEIPTGAYISPLSVTTSSSSSEKSEQPEFPFAASAKATITTLKNGPSSSSSSTTSTSTSYPATSSLVAEFLASMHLSNWLAAVINLMFEFCASRQQQAEGVEATPIGNTFKEFVDVLPTSFGTPIFFAEDEKSELKGTSMEIWADDQMMRTQFEKHVLPVIREATSRKEDDDNERNFAFRWKEADCDYELFRRAAALVASRGFTDSEGNGPYLVPAADLLNHSSKRKATSLQKVGDSFVMIAARDIERGEEVFNDYGNLSNSQLLQTYGFADVENEEFESVNISVELVLRETEAHLRKQSANGDAKNEEDEQASKGKGKGKGKVKDDTENGEEDSMAILGIWEDKERVLRSIEMIPGTGFYTLNKDDMLPDNLLTAIQVLLMRPDEFQEFSSAPRQLGQGFIDEDDEDYMLEIYQILLQIIVAKLKEYPTSLKETAGMVKEKEDRKSDNVRNALVLRFSEQKLLNDLKMQLVEELVAEGEDDDNDEDISE
jgi:hypothetical protein